MRTAYGLRLRTYLDHLLAGQEATGTEGVVAQIQILQMEVLQGTREGLEGLLSLVERKTGNAVRQV